MYKEMRGQRFLGQSSTSGLFKQLQHACLSYSLPDSHLLVRRNKILRPLFPIPLYTKFFLTNRKESLSKIKSFFGSRVPVSAAQDGKVVCHSSHHSQAPVPGTTAGGYKDRPALSDPHYFESDLRG